MHISILYIFFQVPQSALAHLIFTNALDTESDEDKKYEEVPSIEAFFEVATNFLDTYNTMHKSKMNIVLFRFVLRVIVPNMVDFV